jgi:hypothetical protein
MKDITVYQAYELMFKEYPDVLGVKEICTMLGFCPKKVYDLIHEGKIAVIPCGKIIKVAKLSAIEYMLSGSYLS